MRRSRLRPAALAVLLPLLAACGSSSSSGMPARPISKGRAEALWHPYFLRAAKGGPGRIEGTETRCLSREGKAWLCIGTTVVPAEEHCWMEEAKVAGARAISVLDAVYTAKAPPGSHQGRCRIY